MFQVWLVKDNLLVLRGGSTPDRNGVDDIWEPLDDFEVGIGTMGRYLGRIGYQFFFLQGRVWNHQTISGQCWEPLDDIWVVLGTIRRYLGNVFGTIRRYLGRVGNLIIIQLRQGWKPLKYIWVGLETIKICISEQGWEPLFFIWGKIGNH